MTTIGRSAFEGCTNLKTVKIANSVTTVGGAVFNECQKLEDITASEEVIKKLGLDLSYYTALKPDGIHILNLADNPMSLKGKTAKVKYKKLKKKSRTVSVSKVITFKPKGVGTLEFKKTYGNKKITVNKKTGTVTVKKKLKRGTYYVKVKVRALGSETVKQTGWKTVKFKIKVK